MAARGGEPWEERCAAMRIWSDLVMNFELDKSSSAPWVTKWPSNPNPPSSTESPNQKTVPDSNSDDLFDPVDSPYFNNDHKSHNAIDRIVLRFRNLGLEDEEQEGEKELSKKEKKLGDLLRRDWVRPDATFAEDKGDADMVLPWEKKEDEKGETEGEKKGLRKRRVKVGMQLREKANVPNAGLTQAVLDKINDRWRKNVSKMKSDEVRAG